MNEVISITDALHSRMALVAQALAERVDRPGTWEGYKATEPLIGRFTRPSELGGNPTVTYHRKDFPEHFVSLAFLEMTDIKQVHKSDEVIIESNIQERELYNVSLKHAIHDKRTVEHEFTKTISFAEAAKKAWEVAAKASLSVEYAGIKGALEVSGKYGEELSTQSSETETQRDKVSEEFEFTGPIEFKVEAYRSLDRVSQIIQAQCDFDGKVYWWGGPEGSTWEFTTFKSQFLPIARRTVDDSIYGYDEFMNNPMTDEEFEKISAMSDKIIEFTVEYDNVQTITLKEL